MMQRTYGWRPQLPDHRDHLSPFFTAPPAILPLRVDLRANDVPIFDQGNLGSCTANAIGGLVAYQLRKQGVLGFVASRLFIYYNERSLEGTVHSDAGAVIRDGLKVVNKQGVCSEITWPYRPLAFAHKPVPACYAQAKQHTVPGYAALGQSAGLLKRCLAAGQQFVFGFSVYESFESDEVARTGLVPMPGTGEGQLGGHAVRCVGYDDAAGCFFIANSWGTAWGDHGYCYLPYAYVLSSLLASDFWTISAVTG